MTAGIVTLRAVEADDLPILFEQQRDPEANAMADFPARDREAFMAHWARIMADATVMIRTVVVDGTVAGSVLSWAHDDVREVGYRLGHESRGQGIASRALAAFLELEPTRPLVAHVAAHDIASRRVLEKSGFVIVVDVPPTELVLRLG